MIGWLRFVCHSEAKEKSWLGFEALKGRKATRMEMTKQVFGTEVFAGHLHGNCPPGAGISSTFLLGV